ncbi:hypothetical protein KOW79_017724 [Hemibagrus wyckioides]|uniref:Uncharacterized protein n=1 Tax=Hemibagrus wyckioides TaxID=337641 RepID=A0A9D3SD30_9TELE|nr:hypothetical protein KOW79_017724 [Hemibagrus wyckioides]
MFLTSTSVAALKYGAQREFRDANVPFAVPQRREMTEVFDDPGEPCLVGSSRLRSAISAKFSGTCRI